MKIDGAGNFSFPKIAIRGPFKGVFVVRVLLEQNGEWIKSLGHYCGHGCFMNPVPVSRIESDLEDLNIVLRGRLGDADGMRL